MVFPLILPTQSPTVGDRKRPPPPHRGGWRETRAASSGSQREVLVSTREFALSEDERLTGASRLGRLEDLEAESGAVQVINDSPAVVETV